MTDTPASSVRRSSWPRRILIGAVIAICICLVLAALLYLNRREASRQALTGWLERQGIDADVDIQQLEIDRIVARVRIGDPRNPDVVIDRVEMDYAIGTPWSKSGLGLTPSRIRLVRPVVRASWQDGEFSVGSLDPLIDRFTGRPPRPDSRGPVVLIEDGRVRLQTDYGSAVIQGDARLDDGKLMRLAARMPATNLRSGDRQIDGMQANIDLTTLGDRVTMRANATTEAFKGPDLAGQGLNLKLVGDLPYPDLKIRRGDGVAKVVATLLADRFTTGATGLRGVSSELNFDGRATGWIQAFRLDGTTTATTRVASLAGPDLSVTGLTGRVTAARTVVEKAEDVSWRLDGGTRLGAARLQAADIAGSDIVLSSSRLTVGGRGSSVEVTGPVAATAVRMAWTDLSLSNARGALDVDLVVDGGVRLNASGAFGAARGSWPLFGPPAQDDLPELGEMKRAFQAFSVEVPAFAVSVTGRGTQVVLTRPALVRPANGGLLALRPADGPIFAAINRAAGGGALSLTATRGRGLPEAAFEIPGWRLTPDGFTAALSGRATLDFGLARGISLETRGRLISSRGGVRYIGEACVPLTVARLELDENDVTDVSGRFCPAGEPLVRIADGRWRADGVLQDIKASAPFLALTFSEVSGSLAAAGGPAGLSLDTRITTATIQDATSPLRFNPLTATGTARLVDEDWSGAFDLSRNGTNLGRLDLSHDGRAGVGGITIDAPSIVFAEGGLQPSDLSPMAEAFVGSPAVGTAGFQGRLDWRADQEGTSAGRLSIPGLDFVSPAGPVKGLSGTIDFTSLAPLVTAPDQRLTIDRLESFTPLTGVAVTFGLDKSGVTVGGGKVALAGGTVSVEPFILPLDRNQSFSGVIVLDRVQLGEVLAGSGFGENVKLDAVVSGRLPFTSDVENGVRIVAGSLQAVQPGRLSIAREALTGLSAGGGGEGVPPSTVEDLAYQAMENLAFDILSAELNSLDAGRIGVLFRIRGRHDPPQKQELRVSIAELISREFLNRPLPLPSETGIDLTLDTTLNLNQLVGDLLQLNRARNGQTTPPALP